MKRRGPFGLGERCVDGRTVRDALDSFDSVRTGEEMHAWIGRLLPICRSITGEGLRETLRRLGDLAPITLTEVPSGTDVFDWKVPLEWNVREAFVADSTGRRFVDLARSSLHVVAYSIPVRRRMTLEELRPHLHSLPNHPEWIPYRTSYYEEKLGVLPLPVQPRRDGRRDLRRGDRLDPGARKHDARRVRAARRDR